VTLSAVCRDCAGKLAVHEFCTVALGLDSGSRCEGCGVELFADENGVVVGYEAVTPEQLAEIRCRE
jgi:hypothetical protein